MPIRVARAGRIRVEPRAGAIVATYRLDLPPIARPRWHAIVVRCAPWRNHAIAVIAVRDSDDLARGPDRPAYGVTAGPAGYYAATQFFWEVHAAYLTVSVIGLPEPPRQLCLAIVPLPRRIGSAVPRAITYQRWRTLFDRWDQPRLAAIAPTRLSVAALVCGPPSPAQRTSWQSLDQQTVKPQDQEAFGATDYVALLQAGEVVPRHALAVMLACAEAAGSPAIVTADEDLMAADGRRHSPEFKPPMHDALLASDRFWTGIWLVRRDVIGAQPLERGCHAVRLRQMVWRRAAEQNGSHRSALHLPYPLTQRRHDYVGPADAPPPYPMAPPVLPHVTVIVPTAARLPHIVPCVGALLARTTYPNFDLRLVISQPQPVDAAQRALLAPMLADARVSLLHNQTDSFNFAQANNFAAASATAPLLCLVNDDAAPIAPDWLERMVAWTGDAQTAIVGACLRYPDGAVQHGGFVIGLGGLAGHLEKRWITVSREVSAVTGACMVVRRSTYDALGGLDEGFAKSFNDLDFCLRARAAGYHVIYAATAELNHFESQSLGDHYGEEQAEAYAVSRRHREVAVMRARHGKALLSDRFYNPNCSLIGSFDDRVALPPRW